MSNPIQSAPLTISDRAENEMALTITELCTVQDLDTRPAKNEPLCQYPIKIGLFFDGTNNNRERDEPVQSHTNIVKLFKAHTDVNEEGVLMTSHHYKFYIPGLGTRFPENREWRESQDGKAFGKGGQARILFALLQVYNAVYQSFNEGQEMFKDKEITAKLQQYAKDIDTGDPLRDNREPRPNRHSWFNDLNKEFNTRLRKARIARPLPRIPQISISVFGFSRGATLARAFCYWFNDVLTQGETKEGIKDSTFGGMPASIDFLGIFESVASIGLPQSVAETTPLFFADGHFSWAKEILTPLPDCVKETVHFIGAHEQRRNFPITRVKAGKGKVTEALYPGVHADIGGGYRPGDQGRGLWNDQTQMAMLLSQIPLVHMHKAARVAGVPLAAYCVMPSDLKEHYAIDAQLAQAWNDYMAAGEFMGASGIEQIGDYYTMVRKHMTLYYGYRRQYLDGLEYTIAFPRANAQDQEDLRSYNVLLRGDLALLEQRVAIDKLNPRKPFEDRSGVPYQRVLLEGKTRRAMNTWQYTLMLASAAPKPDEIWALAEMKKQQLPVKTPFFALLDFYVHDSLAGFTLAGFGTNEDKAEELLKMATEYENTRKAPETPYKKQVWQNYQQAIKTDTALAESVQTRIDTVRQAEKTGGYRADKSIAKEAADQHTVFTPEQQAALAKLFPLQTDAHAPELLHAALSIQTTTRREGSGYLRQRYAFE
ncbi:T6SS phospholipase effector Tle1-like catalytic domain-containing protein [Glaciimonas sp. GG7]